MSWTYLVFHQLRLVPGFSREIFDQPRSELSFGSLPHDAVSFIYTILWDKLYPIVNSRPGVQSMLATIPQDEVHSLWKLLKRGFCPQSTMEISERGRRFFDMSQGDLSVTKFTTSVLEEKDILKFLGEVKTDADVKTIIIGDCPDKLIPKEELQRRKHPRPDDPATTHNMDRGRGRGRYIQGGRSHIIAVEDVTVVGAVEDTKVTLILTGRLLLLLWILKGMLP